jgi:O-antigen/teichoic acid export membrane protein
MGGLPRCSGVAMSILRVGSNRGSDARGSMARVVRGSAAALLIYVAGTGLTYLSQLLIARIVGADGYGVYAYVFAWATVLAYFSALGFDVALLRFVAAYLTRDDWALLKGVIRFAERWATLVGCGIAIIGISVATFGPAWRTPELTNTFRIGLLLVPVWALLWIRSAATRAFGGVVSALAPDRLVRDGVLVVLLTLAGPVFGWIVDAPAAMVGTLMSSLAGLALVSAGMRWLSPHAADSAEAAYDARLWMATALPLVIIAAAETVMNRTGVMLLGSIANTKDAGIYSLAFNIAFVVALPRIALNALYAPTVSNLFVRGDRAGLQNLVAKGASWTLIGGACIALPLSLFAEPLLSWFGRDFTTGVSALRILLLGQLIAAAAGSQLFLMTMTGHERKAAMLLLSAAALNALLSVPLIRLVGLTGAAVASTIVLIAWNVAMAYSISRHLHILPSVLALFRVLRSPHWLAPRPTGSGE